MEGIEMELSETEQPVKNAFDFDDKDLAMVGITALAIIGALLIQDPTSVIMGAIGALGALATGRKGNNK